MTMLGGTAPSGTSAIISCQLTVDGASPTSLATHAFPAASRCKVLLLLSLSVVEESGQNWGHVAALFQEAGVPMWRRSDGLQELGSNFTGGASHAQC